MVSIHTGALKKMAGQLEKEAADYTDRISRLEDCVFWLHEQEFGEKEELCRILEPHVCTTRKRFEMLDTMHRNGIHTGVWLCPILPFINDTEENLRGLLGYCFEAGVEVIVNFGMGVTLRDGDRQYFYQQLDAYFPGLKEQYIGTFRDRYDCPSPNAAKLSRIFREECRAHGVICEPEEAMDYLTKFEDKQAGEQLKLFT